MYKIGLDIGGTKITIGLFNSASKELIKSEKLYVKNVENVISTLKTEIEKIVADQGGKYEDIESVGVGIPGTVSDDGKKIL